MKRMTRWFQALTQGKPWREVSNIAKDEQSAGMTTTDRFFNRLPEGLVSHAPRRLAAPHLMTAESTLRQHDRANWYATRAEIKEFAAYYIEAARSVGIPLYVHGAFRTKATQDGLKAAGRSRASWPRAPHCQGAAVDVVHCAYHWDMTPNEWAWLGKVGKDVADRRGIEITWGGDWNFYDPAHWELSDWRNHIHKHPQGEPVRRTPRKLLSLHRS